MDDSVKLAEIIREDGVRDLNMAQKAKFAHALQEERMGNYLKAAEYLQAAVDAPVSAYAPTK